MAKIRQAKKHKNEQKNEKNTMFSTISNMAMMVQQQMVNSKKNENDDVNMQENDSLLDFIFSMNHEENYQEVYQCYFTAGYVSNLRRVYNTLKKNGKYTQSDIWKHLVDTCRTIKKANKKE